MRSVKTILIVALAILGLFILPSLTTRPSSPSVPTMASYNPAPANKFHSPLSAMAVLGIAGISGANSTSLRSAITSGDAASSQAQGNGQSIRTNAIRFINDNSSFPQSETTIAVSPDNTNNIVMGFNDGRYLLCPILVSQCAGPQVSAITGFSVSTDGGKTVAKTGDLPDLLVNNSRFVPWGDPSLTPTVDGNFFFSSLLFNQRSPFFGNAILLAKSNSNLFDPNVSCTTDPAHIYVNSCWDTRIVYGNLRFPAFSVEDKDRITVDRDPASAFFGSAYISWDHFNPNGTSNGYAARCDSNLVGCAMISGGTQPIVSAPDPFVGWTTPLVDKNGNVYLAWCNFGTFITLGPVHCRISASAPGGGNFGSPVEILSYMGSGTMLPTATVVIGWATEQFRVSPGIISIASDLSPKTNNLYFTTQVCTSGHYYQFPSFIAPVPPDNPGLCGASTVLLIKSTDSGATWSNPIDLSKSVVNDQSYVSVDSTTGQVYITFYTTQFDKFDHRIDVIASTSTNAGQTFHQFRVTTVSNEPDSDPNMFNYLVPSGLGGAFVAPQYGDYFEATAVGGTLYVGFTANYSMEQGTFQTDPFLIIAGQGNQALAQV